MELEERGGQDNKTALLRVSPSVKQGLDREMNQFLSEDDAAKWRRNNVIVRVDRVPQDT